LRIVPQQAPLELRRVEIGGLVKKIRVVGRDEKSMREPGRYPRHAAGLAREREARPFSKVWRSAAQVHGHIEHLPGHHANELSLGLADLIVQSAQDMAAGSGMIVLDELQVQAGRLRKAELVVAGIYHAVLIHDGNDRGCP
jgi:hypothetical protein